MGYKKYSYIEMAEEMVNRIREGKIQNRNTAYRELVTIKNEWGSYQVGKDAEYLIDQYYSDLKFASE